MERKKNHKKRCRGKPCFSPCGKRWERGADTGMRCVREGGGLRIMEMGLSITSSFERNTVFISMVCLIPELLALLPPEGSVSMSSSKEGPRRWGRGRAQAGQHQKSVRRGGRRGKGMGG